MSAPATIDATLVRPTDERLPLSRAGTLITDRSEQLSTRRSGWSITDDLAKGLSRVQRKILGVAYTMHAYGMRAHAGRVRDYVTPLGIFAVYGIAPDRCTGAGRYTRTRKVAAAQAALSRAVTRLVERGLLVWQDSRTGLWPGGYVLTAAGLAIGAAAPVPVPHIERCARYFNLMQSCRWEKNESGVWRPSEKGGGYTWQLVHEDLDALRCLTTGGGE